MRKPLNTAKDIERQKINAQISELKKRYEKVAKLVTTDTNKAFDMDLMRNNIALTVRIYNLEARLKEISEAPKRKNKPKEKRTDGTVRNRIKTQN